MRTARQILTTAGLAAATLTVSLGALFAGASAATASTGNGPYLTVASPSLNERNAPSTSAAVVGSLPYHSTIYISCQTSGSLVGQSTVWDLLTNGAYVSDYWTNTPAIDAFTSTIPRCPTVPTPPPSAAWGATVTYNEGGAGQCTWWAINEFHVFTGRYPDLTRPGNTGDAKYWAGNAAYRGWTVTATPRVDSIVVFPAGVNGAGSYGHVAWVTAVSGSTITITEMNYAAWNRVDTRTLVPAGSVRYILAP
jgi:surface antigen